MVKGLTSQQVNEQVIAGNVNVRTTSDTKTVKEIVRKNVMTYFNLIYAILALLVILVGSFNSLTFLPAIIINTLIGTLQEISAKKTMDKLTVVHQSRYMALRDGEYVEVPSDELVLGDVIMLKMGTQVPADAKVLEGHVRVNEALLTGEEDEIEKYEDANLLSGSYIVGGECNAVLTQVGEKSYASKLVRKANSLGSDNESEMVRDIDLIVKFAGIVIIPIGIALFVRGFVFSDLSFHDSILSMVAAVVGMVPQGLYILFTAALALSTIKLARNEVLLHDMRSVETLARVDILCVDKTGTITEDRMTVSEVMYPNPKHKEADVERLLADYIEAVADTGATAEALGEKFKGGGGLTATEVTPFTSKTKYSSVKTADGEYYLGAPDVLMGEHMQEKYSDVIRPQEELGRRVLVFLKVVNNAADMLAVIALENPIREDAEEIFTYFKNQEVRVIVISGDNPLTASKLAKRAGVEGAEAYINASRIETDDQLAEIISKTIAKGGKAIMPVFAVERAQEMLYRFATLIEQGRVPSDLPIYLDSPMAVEATKIFLKQQDCFDEQTIELVKRATATIKNLRLSSTPEESKKLNDLRGPAVIMSSAGMCNAGRIKHHLANNIESPKNTIVFLGYQAEGTLGRLILNGVSPVRIHGQQHPVRAEIAVVKGISGHADQSELLAWYNAIPKRPRTTFVVHGEPSASQELANKIRELAPETNVYVPRAMEIYKE